MKVMLVHIGSDDNPRAYKMADNIIKRHDLLFLGWDRGEERNKRKVIPATYRMTYNGRHKSNQINVLTLLGFIIYLYRTIVRYRPDVIHCVNEEMAFLVSPLKGIFYKHLVLDVFDVLIDRVIVKTQILKYALNIIATIAYAKSDHIIVCDERRYSRLGKHEHKSIVVENTPMDPGEALSLQFPSGNVKIGMTGNVTSRRGADAVHQVLKIYPKAKFLIAGILDSYSMELLSEEPNVKYFGVLTPDESLEVIAKCDAVLAFYEPTTTNHIYASPSKIFDCMSVGRPIIINSEALVSNWVLENKLGYSVSYYDSPALSSIIQELNKKRKSLPEFSSKCRSLYIEKYSWKIMGARVTKLYDKINEIF